MQIHELTQRQRVDEISLSGIAQGAKNIAGAVGAVGAGIGKELASAAGFDTSGAVGASTENTSAAFAKSKALTTPMIKPQAVANQKLWDQLVAQQLAAAGLSAASVPPPAQLDLLKKSLEKQIATNFLRNRIGNDYHDLPENIDDSMKSKATETVRALDSAVAKIINFGGVKTDAQSLNEWIELTTAAFDAMRLLQFYPAESARTRVVATGTISPKAAALMNAMGISNSGLVGLEAAIKRSGETVKSTGSESLDDLLRAAKLL